MEMSLHHASLGGPPWICTTITPVASIPASPSVLAHGLDAVEPELNAFPLGANHVIVPPADLHHLVTFAWSGRPVRTVGYPPTSFNRSTRSAFW